MRWQGKYTFFEGGVRVNAFVTGGLLPAAMRGKNITAPVHICDWCESPQPSTIDRSFEAWQFAKRNGADGRVWQMRRSASWLGSRLRTTTTACRASTPSISVSRLTLSVHLIVDRARSLLGIWVAFFQERQQQSCGQGPRSLALAAPLPAPRSSSPGASIHTHTQVMEF